jgi:glycosyltransferase involved in cell wall biosynthesis
MPEPLISVVIPTRDRREILQTTLEALDRQTGLAGPWEVVVADDGSSDGTARYLDSGCGPFSFRLVWMSLSAAGPAVARNRAIAKASARRVLLLGDDMVPDPNVVASHLSGAAGNALGLQGRIEWDSTSPITPVMRFLAPEGPQFYFKRLRHGRPIPYTALYASNLSAPTEWFLREPFDEQFPAAAFEDTELAYRWHRRGYTVLFWEKGICRHRHFYDSIEPFLVRQRLAGRAARYAIRRHPVMAARTVLQPFLVGLLGAVRYAGRRLRRKSSESALWDLRARAAFFQGFFLGNGPSV